ncbi:MAG TPA: DUF222 domain-containing protein, partial [Actinomycetales bacterium]|nr:DUF222 domain-containing protein [Actinomycetales bacterium]
MEQQPPSDAESGAVPDTAPDAVSGAALAVESDIAMPQAALPTAGETADDLAADPMAAWAALGAAATAVAGAPLWRCSDEQLVDLLRAQVGHLASIDAARLALVRELDTRGWAAAVGATSTQAWLAQALRVDPRTAAADVRAARALDPAADTPPEPGLPVLTGPARTDDDPTLAATGRALTEGGVSRAHADAVLASVRALPRHPDGETRTDLTARVEGWLLEQCAVFDPATVRRLGREVLHAVDPAGVLAEELAAAARDELWLTPTPTGQGAAARGGRPGHRRVVDHPGRGRRRAPPVGGGRPGHPARVHEARARPVGGAPAGRQRRPHRARRAVPAPADHHDPGHPADGGLRAGG